MKPRSRLALALAMLALGAGPVRPDPAPRAPAFELRALGVLGGDVDTNLSCYLLGRPGEAPRVMIDGGSVVPGLLAWKETTGELPRDASWSERTRVTLQALRPVEVMLVTHAHLDHVAGFLAKAPLDLLLAQQGRPSLEVVGLPATLDALRAHALRPPLWVDFAALPPGNPALRLAPLEPGTWRRAGPFRVQAIPVHHPDGGAAFLVTSGEDAYLHVGDTGRWAPLWTAVRPTFRAGRLRAVTLEVSWPAAREKLAEETGHLTPPSFLLELADLAGVDPEGHPRAESLSAADAAELAGRLAPHFRACPIIVTHIKAAEYDRVKAELDALAKVGLNLVLPEQGRSYTF